MAHCRAIEEMLKEVERETREKNRRNAISYFLKKTSYTFEQICDLLDIPEDERTKYEAAVLEDQSDTAGTEEGESE